MNEATAINAVIDMVPNWYRAEVGPVHYDIECGGNVVEFWGHRDPTPNLTSFLRTARGQLRNMVGRLAPFADAIAIDLLQEHFALEWLAIVAPGVDWRRVIDYSRECLHRTYENTEVAFNFVISNQDGSDLVTMPSMQKILDPLAASLHTYVRVDRQFRFCDYEEIPWSGISDEPGYGFVPEFLRPFASILEKDEFSVHQTVRGDLIILNSRGLLAAKRKGKWKVYEVETLKNSITQALGNYRVGANMFEVCFDLSFRRHGALLIFDPQHKTLEQVVNPESRVDRGGTPDQARKMLADSIRTISLGALEREQRKKRILLEIASVDGAVVFDESSVLAFGAMIRTHADVAGHAGARSTAAASAYLYGGRPIKVSSDGEITILFKSRNAEGGGASDARLEFL